MKDLKSLDRKEFFEVLGISTAALGMLTCLSACSKNSGVISSTPAVSTGVDFTLDLTATSNSALNTNGGFLVSHNILIARTATGAYIAVQQSCTHQSYPLTYQAGSQRFYCSNHGATFTEQGAVTTGPAQTSLTVYKTLLTGSSLRIQS